MTFEEFIKIWDERHCEVAGSPGAQNQCVDLANAYLRDVLNHPIVEWTNAVDFPKKLTDMEWIENTPTGVPQKGDIVIWGGTYGHIAIFIEGDTNSFLSFDQNFPTGSPCHIQKHNYTVPKVLGWLHPKVSPITSPTDPLQECLRLHSELVSKCSKLELTLDDVRADLAKEQITHQATNDNYQKLIEADEKILLSLEQKLSLVSSKETKREDRISGVMAAIDTYRQKVEQAESDRESTESECVDTLGELETHINEVEYLAITLEECLCKSTTPVWQQLFDLFVQLYHKFRQ